jgi:hypothetical protein
VQWFYLLFQQSSTCNVFIISTDISKQSSTCNVFIISTDISTDETCKTLERNEAFYFSKMKCFRTGSRYRRYHSGKKKRGVQGQVALCN